MEGAGRPLRRVKHAADLCGAGGGRRGQGGAGRVGSGCRAALCLAVRDAAVADLPRLVLQRRGVAHGARADGGWPDPRRLQIIVVLLHLSQHSITV